MQDSCLFFSIIIVCLNAEKTVLNTLDSVLKQSFQNFEIIVKDGLSTDKTISLIPKDKRINVLSIKDNGIYDAMNQAVNVSKGKYVFFLNCGDVFYDENVLQKSYNYLKENNEVCLFGDVLNVAKKRLIKQSYILSNYFWYRTTIYHQSIFVPRKLFNDKSFDSSLKIAADFKFLFNLYKNHIMFIHEDYVVTKYDGSGVSSTKWGKKTNRKEKEMVLKANFNSATRCFFFVKKVISKIFKKRFY